MEEKNRGNNAAETPPKENDFSVPNKRDYEEELLAIIQSDLPSEEIREKLTDYHDNDIASVFGELTQANRRKLYHILSDDEISDIFSYLDNVEDYIAELDAEKAADIIESMDDAELKKWLTDIVRKDMGLGIKIIINKEE